MQTPGFWPLVTTAYHDGSVFAVDTHTGAKVVVRCGRPRDLKRDPETQRETQRPETQRPRLGVTVPFEPHPQNPVAFPGVLTSERSMAISSTPPSESKPFHMDP